MAAESLTVRILQLNSSCASGLTLQLDNFGLMPYRRTIVSVFGRPIPVQKVEKPTKDQVIEIHTQYIAELKR